VMQCSFSMS